MLLTSTSEVATAVVNPCLVISTHMCEQRTPRRGVIKGSLAGRRYSAWGTQQKRRRRLRNSSRRLCTAAAAKQPYNDRPPRMHSLALPHN